MTIGGHDWLGGRDWNDKLFDHIFQANCEENGLEPGDVAPEVYQPIRSCVEAVKKRLSRVEAVKIKINVKGNITAVSVTREEFERITSDLVAKTMTRVEETLKKAGNISIDRVLLVGGSAYMPMICRSVESRFPGKVQLHEPDQAIARGAAIYASMQEDEALADLPLSGGGIWIPKLPVQHPGAALPPLANVPSIDDPDRTVLRMGADADATGAVNQICISME